MLFQLIAPFYDRFMQAVKLDHSPVIAEWLSPIQGRDLLDLAGGTGINAVALSLGGARVTLVDSSEAMLSHARRKEADLGIVRADAAMLPFLDESFDIVLVSDAWHHFREQDRVAAEIVRVLRPDGRLYVIDFDRTKFGTKIILVLEKMLGEPSKFLSAYEMVDVFSAKGVKGECRYVRPNQFVYQGHK